MRALLYLILAATIGSSAVSCCSTCRGARVIPVSGTEWSLIELNGRVIDRGGGRAGRLTLILGVDGRVGGMGDCNRFFGPYTFDGKGRFDISELGSTRVACPNQALEDEYFRALQEAASFRIDGDFLLLNDAGGKLTASFRKK